MTNDLSYTRAPRAKNDPADKWRKYWQDQGPEFRKMVEQRKATLQKDYVKAYYRSIGIPEPW